MNPSAKAAGLSFFRARRVGTARCSSNGATLGRMTAALLAELAAKVRRSARTETAKYFTRWRFPHRNLASIRFSRYVAVGSPAESAFTYADYTRRRRFSIAYLLCGSDSSSPLKREAFSEQKR